MEKEKFSFYRDWQKSLKGLPNEQKLELYNAIVDYGLDGIETSVTPIVHMAMNFIKAQIDRNDERIRQKNERLRENGKLGGRPKKNQMVSEKPNGFCESQKNQMVSEKPNGSNININVNTDINTDINNLDAKASSSSLDDAEPDDCLMWKEERLDIPKFIAFWNKTVEGSVIPAIKLIIGKRRENLNARFKQYGKHDLFKAVTKLGQSNFLKGNISDKGWHATFDWFLGPRNFAKVLEGNYDNQQQASLYGNGYSNNSGAIQGGQPQRLAGYASVMGELLEQGKRETVGGDNGGERQISAGLLPEQTNGNL